MQDNRDSLLKGLAIAFGNGLAVGVGMKLLQPQGSTRRQPAPRAVLSPEARLDQRAIEGVVHALEARLQEQAGHLEQRISDLEAGIDVDLKTLNAQDEALSRRMEENFGALREEIVEMHREFAEAVGRIVAEHVHKEVSGRLKETEEQGQLLARQMGDELQAVRSEIARTRIDVAETIGRALTDQVEAAVKAAVETRLTPVLHFAGAMNRACTELTAKVTPGHGRPLLTPAASGKPHRAGSREPAGGRPAIHAAQTVLGIVADPAGIVLRAHRRRAGAVALSLVVF
jgi:hypothetical protein